MEIDRTCQANERTFLEYLCTGLALVAAGVAIVYFSDGDRLGAVGIICTLIGIIIGIAGAVRFRTISSRISLFQRQYDIDAKNKEE